MTDTKWTTTIARHSSGPRGTGSSAFSGLGSVYGVSVTFLGTVANVGHSLSIGPSNATVNLGGNGVSVPTATISGGTLLGSGGMSVTGQMQWTGGSLATKSFVVNSASNPTTVTISGSAGKALDAC